MFRISYVGIPALTINENWYGKIFHEHFAINDVTHRGGEGFTIYLTMRDVGGGGEKFVTSRTSHLRQGLARESWIRALVHYTGLQATARMAQATENDVGLPQPVSPTTVSRTDGRAPSNMSCHTKNLRCVLKSYRSVDYTTDCKGRVLKVCDVIFEGSTAAS